MIHVVIDVHVKLQELTNKLIHVEQEKELVEGEKQKMKVEYDTQRANYMKLYTQREDEIVRLKRELDEIKKKEEMEKIEREQRIGELCQIIQGEMHGMLGYVCRNLMSCVPAFLLLPTYTPIWTDRTTECNPSVDLCAGTA